ncbi:helix-turn-helix domain-containing protein [Lachnoclostridium sp. MSJ-17]|uniref:helix-turn-helix domain-containing protein n=1 Tax=Lachnoclostridium sp. MSJ-17 TaxID=2841516 RepID=UPI001C108BCE|nr:AraC family transcriptional regulator [Lachnoclostridium sp. MSJ-17]MBU5462394.1 AraC family transcriptional regulator [Lachnoclostridium sp. MSJ-17]
MSIVQQTIRYDKNLPARIRLRDGPIDEESGEPHRHNEIELIYVDSGKLQATIDYQEHEFTTGDVVVIGSNTVHSLESKKARTLTVHFSYVFVKSFFNSFESFDYVLEEGSQERREMQFLMQKLLAIEQNTFDEYSALKKYSVLLRMLRLLLTRCRREKPPVVYDKRRSLESDAIAVKNYIEVNFRRKIMISELAELLHYSPNQITNYFKQLTGKRFTDYLNFVRAEHALEDYLTYDIPVGEAALKNGFCHYNFFSKACNKYYGASPTAIKRARREQQSTANMPLVRTA